MVRSRGCTMGTSVLAPGLGISQVSADCPTSALDVSRPILLCEPTFGWSSSGYRQCGHLLRRQFALFGRMRTGEQTHLPFALGCSSERHIASLRSPVEPRRLDFSGPHSRVYLRLPSRRSWLRQSSRVGSSARWLGGFQSRENCSGVSSSSQRRPALHRTRTITRALLRRSGRVSRFAAPQKESTTTGV